jgi:hypothetical protein
MSLVRSVSGEKILGRYVLVRSVIGPICLKNLGRSVHIFGPKRLGRNVFGPKCLTFATTTFGRSRFTQPSIRK